MPTNTGPDDSARAGGVEIDLVQLLVQCAALWALVSAAMLICFYNAYVQFFDVEVRYIYDPSTEVLYETESQVAAGQSKWKYLLPFVQPAAVPEFLVRETTSIEGILRERDASPKELRDLTRRSDDKWRRG